MLWTDGKHRRALNPSVTPAACRIRRGALTEPRTPLPSAPLRDPGGPAGPLDEARERAIRLLTDGFAYDVITVDEFEWRLGQLGHADSPRAIDALVADLGTPGQAGVAPRPSAVPALAEGRIRGIMSATRRCASACGS
jgi:hypothetical protein